MPRFDRTLIGYKDSPGFETDYREWTLPENAFSYLKNMYIYRDRIRKRFGSLYTGNPPIPMNSRLAVQMVNAGTGAAIKTDGSGNLTASAATAVPVLAAAPAGYIGQSFSVGTQFFTVNALGAPAFMLNSTGVGTGSFNTTNGQVSFSGISGNTTQVIWYPSLPVVGLDLYEFGPVNNHQAFAWDTSFAYSFNGTSWIWEQQTVNQPTWHGTFQNLFWVENWQGVADNNIVMFVTNFNAGVTPNAATDDPIWTFDGTTWVPFSAPGTPYTVVNSNVGAGTFNFILTSRLIIAFKNRLLLLNTIEQDSAGTENTPYVNRCRYSINGSPFAGGTSTSGVNCFAWLEPQQVNGTGNAAGAGFIDATTEEAIVSAGFIKDRLIVEFERSTWELAYTGNEIQPFVWVKLNSELGSQSLLSTIGFDTRVITIGNTGVHACNGSNVERIDDKIPDEIFEFEAKGGAPAQIVGVRDFFTEMVYWAFPSDNQTVNQLFNTQVLVYNYKNGSWSVNDDAITVFGYYEQQSDLIWSQCTFTWESDSSSMVSGATEADFRQVIAGNQEGFVFIIDPDRDQNEAVYQVTDFVVATSKVTVINHGLNELSYVFIKGLTGITPATDTIFQVLTIVDANTFTINMAGLSGTYAGGATMALVSNPQLRTKQFNPYINDGRNVYIQRVDFGVEATSAGAITVDYWISSGDEYSMLQAAASTGALLGNGVLETSPYALVPMEANQSLLWHPVYLQASGEFVQLNIRLSSAQMLNPDTAFSGLVIDSLILWTTPVNRELR